MNEIKIIEKPEPATPKEIVLGTMGIGLEQLIADIIDSGPSGKYGSLFVQAPAERTA